MTTFEELIRRELNEKEGYRLVRACVAAQAYFEKFGCDWPKLLPEKNYPSIESIRRNYLRLVRDLPPRGHSLSHQELLVQYNDYRDEWDFAVQPTVPWQRG